MDDKEEKKGYMSFSKSTDELEKRLRTQYSQGNETYWTGRYSQDDEIYAAGYAKIITKPFDHDDGFLSPDDDPVRDAKKYLWLDWLDRIFTSAAKNHRANYSISHDDEMDEITTLGTSKDIAHYMDCYDTSNFEDEDHLNKSIQITQPSHQHENKHGGADDDDCGDDHDKDYDDHENAVKNDFALASGSSIIDEGQIENMNNASHSEVSCHCFLCPT